MSAAKQQLKCLLTPVTLVEAIASWVLLLAMHSSGSHVIVAADCHARVLLLLCRLGVISLLFLPAIGWVAFNMAQPAFNQLNRMNEIKAEAAGASSSKARRR
jgi:hypothetical protein